MKARGGISFFVGLMVFVLSGQTSLGSCVSTLASMPTLPGSSLSGVGGSSPTDAWAVGGICHEKYSNCRTLIEHYDGTSWSVVPSPFERSFSTLNSVSSSSPTDAWAVGFKNYQINLIEHWDGSVWTEVSTNHGLRCNHGSSLNSVSVNPTDPSDVWIAGFLQSGCQPPQVIGFTEHWDGTQWTSIEIGNRLINAVSATPTSGAWAVGETHQHPYIVNVNGAKFTEWKAAHSCCSLSGVVAIAANDVWAVGRGRYHDPIIEHFDGTAWSAVSSPPISGFASLTSISAVSSSDVWAAGTIGLADPQTARQPLVEHWDGVHWSIVPSENAFFASSLGGIYGFSTGALTAGSRYFGLFNVSAFGTVISCSSRK
jgi:hypothetical protein